MLVWRGAPWLDAGRLRGLTAAQRETAIDAIRGRMLQLGAGLLAAGALLYTALNFRLSREGHVTDRFTKAIEQLGSDRIEMRLGAIYALERIMTDSARDHPTIVEVLAAYVREHAIDPDLERPTTDVQAALTVIGRRPRDRAERGPVDLSSVNLSGADLREAFLEHAKFHKSQLRNVQLQAAALGGVEFLETDLAGANFNGAVLFDAEFHQAPLGGASFWSADLRFAIFQSVDLSTVDVDACKLLDTAFWDTILPDKWRGTLSSDLWPVANSLLSDH